MRLPETYTRNPGAAVPPTAVPAWKAAGALPPVLAVFPPALAVEAVTTTTRFAASHQTPAAPARRPWEDHGQVVTGGQGRLVTDRAIGEWWRYPADPPRRTAAALALAVLMLAAVAVVAVGYGLHLLNAATGALA